MNLGEFKLIAIPRNTIDIVFEKDKIEKLEFLNQPDNDSKSKKVTYIILLELLRKLFRFFAAMIMDMMKTIILFLALLLFIITLLQNKMDIWI